MSGISRTIDSYLNDLDKQYDGTLGRRLGTNWRNIVSTVLLSVWSEGYTTGLADRPKIDSIADRVLDETAQQSIDS